MRLLPLSAVALLGGLAWWGGYHAGRPSPHGMPVLAQAVVSEAPVEETVISGSRTAEEKTPARRWQQLRLLPPAPEHRWKALEFFRAWARTDAAGALAELSGPGAENSTLWPAAEALRAFYSVWATVDPDRAWAAALAQQDPAGLEAVAEVLAPTRPDEVLASNASLAVQLMAKAHLKDLDLLSVTDEDERMALLTHRLMSGPLTKAGLEEANRLLGMMGQWQAEQKATEIASRLTAQSRSAVLPWVGKPDDPFTPENVLIETLVEACAATIAPGNVGEAMAFLEQVGRKYDPFGQPSPAFTQIARQWDTPNLLKTVSSVTGTHGYSTESQSALVTAAVKEVLLRDPAALLSVVRTWPPDVRLSYIGMDDRIMPALTSANAASVKALILSAPAGLRVDLMENLLPFLVEMDLPFAAEQVSRLAADPQPAQGPQDKPWQNDHGLVDPDKLIGRWLEADTPAATAWLEQNPDISMVDIQEATRSWAASDPGAWSQWLNTLPPGHRKDASILGGVRDMVWHDPEAALVWSGQIQDPLARASQRETVLRVWGRYDPAAAAAFQTEGKP